MIRFVINVYLWISVIIVAYHDIDIHVLFDGPPNPDLVI